MTYTVNAKYFHFQIRFAVTNKEKKRDEVQIALSVSTSVLSAQLG